MKVIHLLRKPCSEGTVAANVLRWGTGAMNIDATRIGFVSEADEAESKTKNQHADFGSAPVTGNVTYGDYSMVPPKNYNPPGGRWPANLVLQHLDGCVQDGTKKVKASGFDQNRPPRSTGLVFGEHRDTPQIRHSDPDGTETVAAWACAEGCPVAALDEQSGELKSGVAVRHRGVKSGGYGGRLGVLQPGTPDSGFADTGGASRFFKQVKP